MARAMATDFLHSMRFHVDAIGAAGQPRLIANGRPQAGFSSVSTPAASVGPVEYREGTFLYTRKYPGINSVEDISLSRGVARGDSSFWEWMRQVMEGSGEYRADLDIKHFHRDPALNRGLPPRPPGEPNITMLNLEKPARIYHVREAFPTNHKVASDLEGTSGEISIMELSIAYEHFEVEEGRV